MTFLERLQSSFAQFAEFVPALFGALIILFAGYLLAKLIERGTERVLRRMRLNYLLERGGVIQSVARPGEPRVLVRDVRGDHDRRERAWDGDACRCVLGARELHPEHDGCD